MSRNRGFCLTLNNYNDGHVTALKALDGVAYCCIGFEVGDSGTPHIQGYIHFSGAKRMATVRTGIPGAHIEVRKGSVDQAIDYCQKDGSFEEWGDRPMSAGQKTGEMWKSIMEKAKTGEFQFIEQNYPRIWINLSSKLQSLHVPKTLILDGSLEHEWWVGKTGTGKSKEVWRLYPDHYQKELNKWWCGYSDESVVVVEEWSPKNECTGSQLKIWADRYPFTGQIKGGSMKKIRPLKIIVLSNYRIDQCFMDEQDRLPIQRRFTEYSFPDDLDSVRANEASFRSSFTSCASPTDVSDIDAVDFIGVVQEPSPFDAQFGGSRLHPQCSCSLADGSHTDECLDWFGFATAV